MEEDDADVVQKDRIESQDQPRTPFPTLAAEERRSYESCDSVESNGDSSGVAAGPTRADEATRAERMYATNIAAKAASEMIPTSMTMTATVNTTMPMTTPPRMIASH